MDWTCFQLFFLILVVLAQPHQVLNGGYANGSSLGSAAASELGSPCGEDGQCKVTNSYCSSGVCTCKHYFAAFGTTDCLESKLLGRECTVSEQCSLRVANSTCRSGFCDCSQGFIRFRKHTCLGPAKPGDVCYSDEHCKLWSGNSHCKFLIPKLFGKCVCDSQGTCTPSEAAEPLATDSAAVDGIKTNATETTTDIPESDNDGEVAERDKENVSEESKEESQKTSSPFVDPFQHQKEHLQDLQPEPGPNKKPQSASIGIPPAETAMENAVVKDGGSPGSAEPLAASADGSKYRVDGVPKDAHAPGVHWSAVAAVSLGYPCHSDVECQKRDSHSRCLDGVCDCVSAKGTNRCNSQNTGCGPETFQCRESGICISWFFVCDGRNDCPDKSDEACHGSKCPGVSFRCGESESCVSRAVVCDGVNNCPHGEDERFCTSTNRNSTRGCPEHTFQCADGQCLPKFEFCNAIPKCSDGSDESPLLCSGRPSNDSTRENCPFQCGNGRCRSTAIVCSGRDGCGDNSDEASCSVCRAVKVGCPVPPNEN